MASGAAVAAYAAAMIKQARVREAFIVDLVRLL
jgi:hypothetical protein